MKIAFIAPYEELAELVKKVSTEMGINVDAFTESFQGAGKLAKELEKQGYDILISRGATYSHIIKAVSIPVIDCYTTSFDILYALFDAMQLLGKRRKVGLILSNQSPLEDDKISEVFDIELLYKTSYNHIKEVKYMVEEAIENGAEVIIGGIATESYAEELGKKGVLLKTSSETVRQAINNAVEIMNISREQMIEAERLNQILSFSCEGIMVVDSNGIVTYFNPAAEKIMGIKAEKIIGSRADKYITTTKLIDVVKSGESQLSQIQEINGNTIITNRVPISVKGIVQGAIATIQETNKIQDYEIKIRSEIYKKGLVAKYTFDNYIGESKPVKTLISKAKIYSKANSTVLVLGESGTGKEILAQAIHNYSKRKSFPFIAMNCSAIPENLLESELFGYDEGAFTGAKKDGKMGLFETAHKGTIFLDEIGSMPMNLQSRLLRVLQEREVWRLGSNRVVKVDVRVIAATNNNLFEAVEKGDFRKDLYYRLNVLQLETTPLRERTKDIDMLINYFANIYCKENIKIDEKIKKTLKDYHWPGNVRELENFIERVSLLYGHIPMEEIYADFITENREEGKTNAHITDDNLLMIRKGTLKEMEEDIIKKLYKEYDENATLLSERLRISRTTLWKKLKNIQVQ